MLGLPHILLSPVFTTNPRNEYNYHSYFTNKETEAQRGKVRLSVSLLSRDK